MMQLAGMAAVVPVLAASASTMGAASAVGRASVQAGHMAATAAVSMGAAVASMDAASAVTSAAEMTATTAAAGTGVAAAAVLAAGSVGMAATGAATAMALAAASGTYDLGSAAACAVAAAVLGEELEDRRQQEDGEHMLEAQALHDRPANSCAASAAPAVRSSLSQPLWQPEAAQLGGAGRRRRRLEASCCCCAPFLRAGAQQAREGRCPQEETATEPAPARPASDEPREAETERSRGRLQRHVEQAPWHPTVLLYDASLDPPPLSSAARTKPRRAYHLPMNARRPSRIDNDHFAGSFLFMHRLPDEGPSGPTTEAPYQGHFTHRTRRWEARVQGRFRRKPTGRLYTGCVLEDFDYSIEQSWAATTLAAAVVPLLEAVVGERFYFSWGTRGEAAEEEDAEPATIVTNLAGTDQVIVTPATEPVPGIDSDISDLGLRRNAMSGAEYRQAVQQVVEEIDTQSTYTFCVWGCSRYIDVMSSSFIAPALGSVSYAGFLDEWPAHFILYSLEDDEDDPRHLERKKTYFVDVMVWSSDMHLPKLPLRYSFEDEKRQEEVPTVS
mmetsp:Transcript_83415/g.253047  ORF Transcript_83415/g.253047 Transcript_83415/m.253047 type:complete len:557 (-) Transcript_83415:204-1874(-)